MFTCTDDDLLCWYPACVSFDIEGSMRMQASISVKACCRECCAQKCPQKSPCASSLMLFMAHHHIGLLSPAMISASRQRRTVQPQPARFSPHPHMKASHQRGQLHQQTGAVSVNPAVRMTVARQHAAASSPVQGLPCSPFRGRRMSQLPADL